MTHDEAVVFMVESNFQRETILPSEKAFGAGAENEAVLTGG